ncbi:MAG: phosphatase PAP2 family protein [Rhizobiaceae bacterium]
MPKTTPAYRRPFAAIRTAHGRLWRPSRLLPQKAWTSAMTMAAFGALLAVAAVMPFDEKIMRAVIASGLPMKSFMAAITDVGKSEWYLVPAALLFFVSAFADWSLRNTRGKARLAMLFGQSAWFFGAVALSGIAVNIIKLGFGRARPKLIDSAGAWDFTPFSTGYLHASFPSGHATTMGAVGAALVIWFPRWRLPFFILALFGASTRIAAQAHYPSDVAAGFAFGFLFSLQLARVLARRQAVFKLSKGRLLPSMRSGAGDT